METLLWNGWRRCDRLVTAPTPGELGAEPPPPPPAAPEPDPAATPGSGESTRGTFLECTRSWVSLGFAHGKGLHV